MKPDFVKTSRILWVTLVLFFVAVFPAAAQPRVVGVGAIGLTVSDMDRSVKFFSQVLAFKKVSDVEFHDPQFDKLTGVFGARVRIVTMKLGEETIKLTEYLTPPGRPIPWDSRSNDRWFQHIAIVVKDMDAAYARLRRFKVKPISTEPQRIPDSNQAAAGIRAFYFRDPDNHPLELIYFPSGKGNPRWKRPSKALFLGIDHTAITVGNTEQSLKFYRDLLGLKVAGESLNYGVEQEYLNHVAGTKVRITGLRASKGPGIEFLEYLNPKDGRPYPTDASPNDLWNWQITLQVEDIDQLVNRLRSEQVRFISQEVVDFKSSGQKELKAALVRDPDGHALCLRQQNISRPTLQRTNARGDGARKWRRHLDCGPCRRAI